MAPLPNAQRAVIEPERLRDYILSPEHRYGKHEARVFRSALGIDWGSWEYLRDQIANRVEEAEVSEVRAGKYGVRYSVPMLIEGLNGRTHEVTTGWIVEEEGAPPRLTQRLRQCPLIAWTHSTSSS